MEDNRGKKLLSNLKAAFVRDPNIDEFDLLPVLEPKHNVNPLMVVDHKLGIEIWAAKVLVDFAYQQLIQWRRRLPQTRDIEPSDLLNLSRAVLMFNPDNATAWNIRKELIQTNMLQTPEDLALGSLILTKHPKSPETFAHRKWVLQRRKAKHFERLQNANIKDETNSNINDNDKLGCPTSDAGVVPGSAGSHLALPMGFVLDEQVRAEVQREVDVCGAAAEKYANNYNAWSHRIWVLQEFTANHSQVLTSELQQTESWMSRHVSDYSGFHYRQFLLHALGFQCAQLDTEITLVSDLIERYPGHEALWAHRRAIIQNLLMKYPTSPPESSKTSTEQVTKKTRILNHRDVILEQEEEFCAKIAKASPDEWQRTLLERHRKWLPRLCSNERSASHH